MIQRKSSLWQLLTFSGLFFLPPMIVFGQLQTVTGPPMDAVAILTNANAALNGTAPVSKAILTAP